MTNCKLLVTPLNNNCYYLRIRILNVVYTAVLLGGTENGRKLESATLSCDRNLAAILKPYIEKVKFYLVHSKNVADFAIQLKDMVFELVMFSNTAQGAPVGQASKALLKAALDGLAKQLNAVKELGKPINFILKNAQLLVFDFILAAPKEQCLITVQATRSVLDSSYRYNYSIDAPGTRDLSEFTSIESLLEHAEHEMAKYHKLWRFLERLDARYCILEPLLPAPKSATFRKIALASNLNVYIVFDVGDPEHRQPTLCKILGPSAQSRPLQQKLNELLAQFPSVCDSVIDFIAANLAVTFLDKSARTLSQADASTEQFACGICYSYFDGGEADGETPSIYCTNAQCNKSYHHSCLLECFKAAGSSRVLFNRISGECPYCTGIISIDVHI